jgi:protein-S-isoprenylcysteine O-methyltransferase Ste14
MAGTPPEPDPPPPSAWEGPPATEPSGRRQRIVRALGLWIGTVFAAWAVLPFVAAGTLAWWPGWIHLAAVTVGAAAERAFVARRSPALLRRRRRLGAGTKRWDLAWNALWWPFLAAVAVRAGFGHRSGGPSLPFATLPAGLLLLAAGFSLSAWAMASNPFFEGTVRIQREVGHHVVEAGPYRRIRHPGYLGLCLWATATPLILRSRAAVPVAVGAVAWVVLRTVLEDATLRRELPGYAEYARRVRFRLLPGLF